MEQQEAQTKQAAEAQAKASSALAYTEKTAFATLQAAQAKAEQMVQQQEAQAKQATEARAEASAALAQARKEAADTLQEAQAKAAQLTQQQESQARQAAEATTLQASISLMHANAAYAV